MASSPMTIPVCQLFWRTAPVILLAILCGCQCCQRFSTKPGPSAPVYNAPPKELQKITLPDYVIEPPDVLTIDAVRLIPRSPYRLRPLDTLRVQATGLPEEAPLAGDFPVGIDGTLVLGFGYDVNRDGRYDPLRVVGLTLPEARDLIKGRLETVTRRVQIDVWVSLVSIAAQQDVAGEHLVAPDGTVNLGTYGRVRLVGMNLDQAKAAIEAHLSARFEQPEVAVDVYGYNSKAYYVVTQGAGLGDQVVQLPVTGNETALDAISQIQGLTATSSTQMWIARPGKNGSGGDQILPIDWLSITQRGETSTNYQILPGDRIYVAEDKLVALDTTLAKIIAPFERVFGVTLLGTQTLKAIKFFDNPNTNL